MKRGFTVGETLLVLAMIILVVVAGFMSMRVRDPIGPSCLSQERVLGLALIQYTDSYDGFMPPPTHNMQYTWRNAAYPQVCRLGSDGNVSKNIYKCPEDKRPTGPDGYFQSYAFNAGSVMNKWGAKPASYGTIPHPETLVLLFEVQNNDFVALDIDDVLRFTPSKHILAVRHSGGSNYLFADGHAKWFQPSVSSTAPSTMNKSPIRWHRNPFRPLSKNALAVIADAQVRAR